MQLEMVFIITISNMVATTQEPFNSEDSTGHERIKDLLFLLALGRHYS